MRTLIYSTVKEQFKAQELANSLKSPKSTASVRVVEFWQGETEKCDEVITDNQLVKKAYESFGVTVAPYTKKEKPRTPVEETPVQVSEPTPVELATDVLETETAPKRPYTRKEVK